MSRKARKRKGDSNDDYKSTKSGHPCNKEDENSTQKASHNHQASLYKDEADSKPSKLKNINLNTKASNYSNTSFSLIQKMIPKDRPNRIPCSCQNKSQLSNSQSRPAGWEGPAVLHHGSHIKIGCFQFIFSITSHNSAPQSNFSISSFHS